MRCRNGRQVRTTTDGERDKGRAEGDVLVVRALGSS